MEGQTFPPLLIKDDGTDDAQRNHSVLFNGTISNTEGAKPPSTMGKTNKLGDVRDKL